MSDTLAVARYLEDVPCVKRVLYPRAGKLAVSQSW